MNDKDIMLDKTGEQDEIVRVSHRKVWGTMVAAVLCLLLSGLVWICVMNTQDTDYIPIRVVAPAGYTCTLSEDGVTVQGKVLILKTMDEIVVELTSEDIEYIFYYYDGEAPVNENILLLPSGVSVSTTWEAVLTVKAKK